MEERTNTLVKWMNKAFNTFQEKELENIFGLRNPTAIESVLLEIDNKYFTSVNILISETESTQQYNMNLLYKQIVKFYKDVIGIEFEDTFFNAKDPSSSNYRKLAELITGIAAQCDKRGYYLQIMQNMENEVSTELFTILTERISAYTEDMKIQDFRKSDDSEDDGETGLYIRLENLEIENAKLHEELYTVNDKVADLTKENFTYELTIKELEGKYHELINSFENRHSDNNKSDYEDTVSLSIQLSELRGKLEAREKNLSRLKEDKEKIIDDYKSRLLNLQKENELLREKSIKYDVLKEKMHALDEVNNLKAKLIQSERVIADQEDKIKKLKNYDVDKSILLKKIEELNFDLSQEKEKTLDLFKEINFYKDTIIQHDSEIKFYKRQLESYKSDPYLDPSQNESTKTVSLSDLEEQANLKRNLLELEARVKFLQADKDNFYKEKSDLEDQITELTENLVEKEKRIEKLLKKDAKYSKYKDDRKASLAKLTEMLEKIHELKAENENLKYLKGKEIAEVEASYNNQINSIYQKHQEELFNLKESLNKSENENNYLKKEVKKTEELAESNRLYIEELQRKMSNPNSDNKLIEIEHKLKELATNENIDLKRKISEKEEAITKLNEKIKCYEGDYSSKIEKFKKLVDEHPIELKKRDETINYYKQQVELKDKLHNDEQQLVSSLFHQLALEYSYMQSKQNGSEGPLNFSVDKL